MSLPVRVRQEEFSEPLLLMSPMRRSPSLVLRASGYHDRPKPVPVPSDFSIYSRTGRLRIPSVRTDRHWHLPPESAPHGTCRTGYRYRSSRRSQPPSACWECRPHCGSRHISVHGSFHSRSDPSFWHHGRPHGYCPCSSCCPYYTYSLQPNSLILSCSCPPSDCDKNSILNLKKIMQNIFLTSVFITIFRVSFPGFLPDRFLSIHRPP